MPEQPSVWREVQELLYQRFVTGWGDTSPVQLGNETFDPPDGLWAKVLIMGRPSSPGTLGAPGRRRVDRSGAIFVLLRIPPGSGVGSLSDVADKARKLFEGARIFTHDIRPQIGDIGDEGDVDEGRWWGCAVEVPFDYEDWN